MELKIVMLAPGSPPKQSHGYDYMNIIKFNIMKMDTKRAAFQIKFTRTIRHPQVENMLFGAQSSRIGGISVAYYAQYVTLFSHTFAPVIII